ncbi:MAG: bifunctional oligoribonuclease/PAP phosphatase NrnA [Planctomycetes bacterium]|nr:bifunctional oligoribonuclease/PAP phosphatase NrnA [Planctomycetota bacterium]
MIDSNDFQKAIELVNKSSNVLITTHTRPDGDACGSMVALADTLTTLGKNVKHLMLSPVPQWYEFLFTEKAAVLGEDISVEQLQQGKLIDPDLIIIVDTNSNNQLSEISEYLKQNDKPVLVIDHHVTTDNLGSVELVDSSAAAAGLIVFDFLQFAGWHITKEIAQALFVAITTDTGWFQFDNTDSRVLRTTGELVDFGINTTQIHHDIYQNFSPQRFKLMTAMLNTLELHFDGRYAAQQLTQQDFKETGAEYSDTENLIDQCRKIGSVQAAALFVELADGQIKCSLRSSSGIDVRIIAQKFGGGGHVKASGAHLPGPIENAKQLIFDAFGEQFG